MKIKQFIREFETIIPRDYQENFDNTGLLVGDYNSEITKILVTLDCTENVIEEALNENCNLILSFHPIIFKNLKSITGKNYVEKIVLKAIKNNISIYSMHTALDNHIDGVNKKISEKLNLSDTKILIPKKNVLKKLTVFCPKKYSENLKNKLFEAGAGNIGNYQNCSFSFDGVGTFKGNEYSNPHLGEKGILHKENEECINMIFPFHLEKKILYCMIENHPYEEIAYEIIGLDNLYQNSGMGMIGTLENSVSESEFLDILKNTFHSKCIKHSNFLNKKIKTVAVLGGSGSFAIEDAINKNADIFITSDLKYHDFFSAEDKILLADIGHYESEQYTKNILFSIIKESFTKLAVCFSKVNTNPINYF